MTSAVAKGSGLSAKINLAVGLLYLVLLAGAGFGVYAYVDLARSGDPAAPDKALGDAIMAALVVVVVAGVAALYACLYLHRAITQPVRRLHAALERVSEGDLTVELESDGGEDEIGATTAALNATVARLADIIGRVAQAADGVYRGAQELSAAAAQLSGSAQSQASSLEETAASMEQMTSTVKHNADNALEVDKLAADNAAAAQESVAMASSLQRSMGLINESSNRISDIIGVIDEIAFQTNLLAL